MAPRAGGQADPWGAAFGGVGVKTQVESFDGYVRPVVRMPRLDQVNGVAGWAEWFRLSAASTARGMRVRYDEQDVAAESPVSVVSSEPEPVAPPAVQADGPPCPELVRGLEELRNCLSRRRLPEETSDRNDGFCYLEVVAERYHDQAIAMCGSWPTLRQLVAMPLEWLADMKTCLETEVTVRGKTLHFRRGGGVGSMSALDVLQYARNRVAGAPGPWDLGPELLEATIGGEPPLPWAQRATAYRHVSPVVASEESQGVDAAVRAAVPASVGQARCEQCGFDQAKLWHNSRCRPPSEWSGNTARLRDAQGLLMLAGVPPGRAAVEAAKYIGVAECTYTLPPSGGIDAPDITYCEVRTGVASRVRYGTDGSVCAMIGGPVVGEPCPGGGVWAPDIAPSKSELGLAVRRSSAGEPCPGGGVWAPDIALRPFSVVPAIRWVDLQWPSELAEQAGLLKRKRVAPDKQESAAPGRRRLLLCDGADVSQVPCLVDQAKAPDIDVGCRFPISGAALHVGGEVLAPDICGPVGVSVASQRLLFEAVRDWSVGCEAYDWEVGSVEPTLQDDLD